jgi:hypothetical protein
MWSGRFREEGNRLPLPGLEPRIVRPVTEPATLSLLRAVLVFYCNSVYYFLNYINYAVYVRLPRAHPQNKIFLLSDSHFINGFQKYENETNKIEQTRKNTNK